MRRVYHFHRLRITLLPLAGSLAFVLASGWILRIASGPLHWIGGMTGILFFGGCLLLAARTMLRRRSDEAVVLTPSSCTIADPLGNRLELPWREIERLGEFEINGQHFIALFPRDPAKVCAQAPGRLKRKLMEWNTACTGTPVSIPVATIRCDRAELLATLLDYLHRYGR